MAKFLSERKRVEVPSFSHSFEYEDLPGAGYGIDCTKDGTITARAFFDGDREEHIAYSTALFNKLMSGEENGRKIKYMGIKDYSYSYTESAVIECARCMNEVGLDAFTNTCRKCGADYNMSGDLLADRSQWGEETNESIADILSANAYFYGYRDEEEF